MEPLHNALELLNTIIESEKSYSDGDAYPFSATSAFCARFSCSDRTLKRLISDLKDLGAEIYSERHPATGRYVWRCQNWEELARSGMYYRWLDAEREKAAGMKLNEL